MLQLPEKARAELCSLRQPAEGDIQQGLHFMYMQISSTFYIAINCSLILSAFQSYLIVHEISCNFMETVGFLREG